MGKNIKSVLVIDDDQDDQFLFQEALKEADNTVMYYDANNGADALEKLDSGVVQTPDIIFMDVNMPIMNGPDCLSELKKSSEYKSIPVIMYSTSCCAEYQQEYIAAGAEDYIVKPSDFFQFCNILKLILNCGLPIKRISGEL